MKFNHVAMLGSKLNVLQKYDLSTIALIFVLETHQRKFIAFYIINQSRYFGSVEMNYVP